MSTSVNEGPTESAENGSPSVARLAAWETNRRGQKISERLARQISDHIVFDEVSPGTALPSEAEMTQIYGVARGTLREALRILEVQGIISIKTGAGGGPVVEQLRPDNFANMATFYLRGKTCTYREVLQARLAIDPLMARIAAERRSQEGLNLISSSLPDTDELSVDDVLEWQRLAGDFHEAVARMSGNPVLYLLGASLRQISYRLRVRGALAATPLELREEVVTVHRKIADAIMAGEGVMAEELMRDHMIAYVLAMDKANVPDLDEVVDW